MKKENCAGFFMDAPVQNACEMRGNALSYIVLALERTECQKCQSRVFETPVDTKKRTVLSGGIRYERKTVGRQSRFEDG